jgi:hypothetical protein
VSYEQRQRSASRHFSTDMSVGQMEFLECLFPTDCHSVPSHYTEVNAGPPLEGFLDLFCFLKEFSEQQYFSLKCASIMKCVSAFFLSLRLLKHFKLC